MVIGDNPRILHSVEACDAQYARRTLHTKITRYYGLSRFAGSKQIGEVLRDIAEKH